MARSWRRWCGVTVLLLGATLSASAGTRIDLDGPGWSFRTTLDARPHSIAVPHCWPVMKEYREYVGDAIYQRDFDAPALAPGQLARLHFDGVYLKAHVWLNGHQLGEHNGGYTPFEFEITEFLHSGRNHLLVEVDNTPTLTTIPALAMAGNWQPNPPPYGTATGQGMVGWMPYGGIVRPVSLLITDAVYLRGMKIEARPDLKTMQAALTVRVSVHNGGAAEASVAPLGTIAALPMRFQSVRIAAGGDAEVTWTGTLPNAHLWSVRDPFLYKAEVAVPGDSLGANIGVREIRVKGTELLLNGKPVHLFGANRVSEDPDEGLRESPAIIERDLSDMLADNMRMMRIAHYPQAPELLDFADRHGMLMIAEAGNWNFSAWQMADTGLRALWQRQMREMVEQDWNHPSIIAWSVGNEFESASPEGIAWTRDMRAFTLKLDSTRLITFASRFTGDPAVHNGTDEASQYSDFVSANFYGDYANRLDHVHSLWPDKPVFITEFGSVGEDMVHDSKRIAEITTAVGAMKARPWVIGGSLWTWADYRSLLSGTPADGIRKWGVVDLYRGHRDSWEAVRKLFETELP